MSKTFFFSITEATMPMFDSLKKIKRLKLFEPSLGVLGFLAVAVFVILSFIYLDYLDILGKSFGILGQSEQENKVEFLGENGGSCDLFSGKWVWDESYPLYQSKDCIFLDQGFRCTENGRPDLFYTQWRWQPRDCNIPRLVHIKKKTKLVTFIILVSFKF